MAVPSALVAPTHGPGNRSALRLVTATVPSIDRTLCAVTRRGAHRHPAHAALLTALDDQVRALRLRQQASQ